MSSSSYIGKDGAPLKSDAAEERQLLIEATEEFARRLKRAIERGTETVDGILATVADVKHFQPWRFNR
jgi:hypothetical protein